MAEIKAPINNGANSLRKKQEIITYSRTYVAFIIIDDFLFIFKLAFII